MNLTFWTVMPWVVAFFSIPPFILMYIAWIALRLKKLSLAKWRRYQRLWLYLGLTILSSGAIFHFSDNPEAQTCTYVALVGGVMNAFFAFFQGLIVDALTRPPRSK